MTTQDEFALDVSEEAKQEGLTLPVTIAPSLVEQLQPNPYLASLGITFEQRISTLLQVVRTHFNPSMNEKHTILPFMLVRGPLVREEVLSVKVAIHTGHDGQPAITLTHPRDNDKEVS